MKFQRADLLLAFRLAATATVAFSIAVLLDIPNPFWAAMPVWAVAQMTRGLVLERGAMRLVGTWLGAAVGLGIFTLLKGYPYFALVLLSAWIAITAAMIQMLRGGLGYGALMAGMTAAIVVLPSLLHPEGSMVLAISRAECTFIGVLVGTFFAYLATPESRRDHFYKAVQVLSADTVATLSTMFDAGEASIRHASENRILREFVAVQNDVSIVEAGSLARLGVTKKADAFIRAALETLAAGRALSAKIDTGQLSEAESAHTKLAVRSVCDAWQSNDHVKFAALCADLKKWDSRLARALEEHARASSALVKRSFGNVREPGRFEPTHYFSTHRDVRLAMEAGLLAGFATGAASALAFRLGWPPAGLSALGVSVVSMLLGAQMAPGRVAVIVLKGACAGVAVAALYRALILPHVSSEAELIVSLIPFFVIGGFARAWKKTTAPALDANLVFLMASHAALPALAHGSIVQDSVALASGIALTCLAFIWLPSADRRYRSAASSFANEWRRMTKRPKQPQLTKEMGRATRHLLRLVQHAPSGTDHFLQPGHSLVAALNLSDAVFRLRSMRSSVGAEAASCIHDALKELRAPTVPPQALSERFQAQARKVDDAAAAACLLDAANALRQCHGLIFPHLSPAAY